MPPTAMSRPAYAPYLAVKTTTSSIDVPTGLTSRDTHLAWDGTRASMIAAPRVVSSDGQKRELPFAQSEKPHCPT